MGRPRKMRRKTRYDVHVLHEGIWWRQTGRGNRWGNEGFAPRTKDTLVKRLLAQGIPRENIRVEPHQEGYRIVHSEITGHTGGD